MNIAVGDDVYSPAVEEPRTESKIVDQHRRSVSTVNAEGRSEVSVRYIPKLGEGKKPTRIGQKSPDRSNWKPDSERVPLTDVVLSSIEHGQNTAVLKVLRKFTGIKNSEFTELLASLPALVMAGLTVEQGKEFVDAITAAGGHAKIFEL